MGREPDNYISNGFGSYWSSELGWVESKEDATYFTDEEMQTFHLPAKGQWENDRGKEP